MARRLEYYFQVMKMMANTSAPLWPIPTMEKICFQHEKIIFISLSNRIMFFLLYGQKSEQANREHINPVGKQTCFSRVTYFFISSLVKIWKILVF